MTISAGTRVRELRRRNRFTQQELADRADISRTAIARIETGALPVFPAYRTKLSNVFGIDPNELL